MIDELRREFDTPYPMATAKAYVLGKELVLELQEKNGIPSAIAIVIRSGAIEEIAGGYDMPAEQTAAAIAYEEQLGSLAAWSAMSATFFVDENDLALGKALAKLHGNVLFPGHPDLPAVPRQEPGRRVARSRRQPGSRRDHPRSAHSVQARREADVGGTPSVRLCSHGDDEPINRGQPRPAGEPLGGHGDDH